MIRQQPACCDTVFSNLITKRIDNPIVATVWPHERQAGCTIAAYVLSVCAVSG